MDNFSTIVHWHNCDKEMPGSGDYLTISRSGVCGVRCLPYSNKHKAFNCHDHDEKPEHTIDVAYWAYIPTRIERLCEELWKKYTEDEDNE